MTNNNHPRIMFIKNLYVQYYFLIVLIYGRSIILDFSKPKLHILFPLNINNNLN